MSAMDLENQGSHYSIPKDKLHDIFDPKSLRALQKVGGWEQLAFSLNASPNSNDGLSSANLDKEERQRVYGVNCLPEKVPVTFWGLCREALCDTTTILLSIFAFISLALGLYQTFCAPPDFDEEGRPLPKVDWVEGCAILLAVVIIVLVSAVNDYNKERQFMKLNAKKEDRKVIVFRDGEKSYIPVDELLVGDLLYIETGDILPADCIMVHGKCQCDESSVTGESKNIEKSTVQHATENFDSSSSLDVGDKGVLDPILISGSKVIAGQARAVVVCVGVDSLYGKTMMSLNVEEHPTPLQEKLEKLTNGISRYAFLAAVLLLIILILEFALDWFSGEFDNLPSVKVLNRIMNIFITSITIVVVAIPEGLPLAVTLALAFATTKMAKDGNLVRVLKSCETMGSATAICSDKTGTLTLNKMKAVEFIVGLKRKTVDEIDDSLLNNKEWEDVICKNILLNSTAFQNKTYDSKHENANNGLDAPELSLLDKIKNKLGFHHSYQALAAGPTSRESDNNESNSSNFSGDFNNENQKVYDSVDQFVGSKTECALLSFVADKYSSRNSAIDHLQKYRDENELKIIQVIPFESALKWSGLALKNRDNSVTIYLKGAAEIIMKQCKYYRLTNGEKRELDDKSVNDITSICYKVAGEALRTVSLASYTFTKAEWTNLSTSEFINFPFTLDLTVGIQDPLRPGVKESIKKCHRAGVDVKMVTGDSLLTAKAISLSCGILDSETFNNPRCSIEGPKFRSLSVSERKELVPHLHVMARSSPEDKRILVETLKSLGEVVAVTGDGTNDAPALKLADVGFSMGISGTEVAREASDIVLMSDDFTSIVDAIKWGRTIGNSIKKFVQFQLTVNITAVVLTFWTSVSSKDNNSVLTAVQLLWVNLIMDTLAALALATDKPDDDVLDSKPGGRNDSMIDIGMWKMIIGTSIVQLFITISIYYHGGEWIYGKHMNDLTGLERKTTASMNFNTFVWMQVFTLFVSRKLNECQNVRSVFGRFNRANIGFFKGLGRNNWFISIVVLIAVGQVLIMEFGGFAFSVTPQNPMMLFIALAFGFSMIPVGALLRLIPNYWISEYLPLSQLYIILTWVEWALFGFGFWTWVYNSLFPENDVQTDSESRCGSEEQDEFFIEPTSSNGPSGRRESHNLKHLSV